MKSRVPITDKNGKQTHVWKVDDQGRHDLARIKHISHVGTSSVSINGSEQNPLGEAMDSLWHFTNTTIQHVETYNDIRNQEPDIGGAAYEAWTDQFDRARRDVVESAITAQYYIEDMERELLAHEIEDNTLYDKEDYETGIAEVILQQKRISEALGKAGFTFENSILSLRVLRNQEEAVRDARRIYGSPAKETSLSNGYKSLRFKHGDSYIDMTIGRLGNVATYEDGFGNSYFASGIDFPVRNDKGNYELRGIITNELESSSRADIIKISTGN